MSRGGRVGCPCRGLCARPSSCPPFFPPQPLHFSLAVLSPSYRPGSPSHRMVPSAECPPVPCRHGTDANLSRCILGHNRPAPLWNYLPVRRSAMIRQIVELRRRLAQDETVLAAPYGDEPAPEKTLDVRIVAIFSILAAGLLGGLSPLFVKVGWAPPP